MYFRTLAFTEYFLNCFLCNSRKRRREIFALEISALSSLFAKIGSIASRPPHTRSCSTPLCQVLYSAFSFSPKRPDSIELPRAKVNASLLFPTFDEKNKIFHQFGNSIFLDVKKKLHQFRNLQNAKF